MITSDRLIKSSPGFLPLSIFCSVCYFVSYISRINLAAVMLEMVTVGAASEKTIALALSACSITYGAGQIISGAISDKVKPQNVLFSGLILTSLMNISVGFFRDGRLLIALWAINGFAQALMWPPIVSILSSHMTTDEYSKACVYVSWGSSFGTMAVYAFIPLIINHLDYRFAFFISGAAALAMAFIWKALYEKHFSETNSEARSDKTKSVNIHKQSAKFETKAVFFIVLVMLAIIMQGALRDGISNWMPTFINQTCHLDTSTSIFAGVLLPVFHIICVQIASYLNRRKIPNTLTCAGVLFAAGCIAALMLSVSGKLGAAISVVLLALLVGSMHGVNVMLTCIVPAYFRKYGHVSLIAGVLNSATYIGASVSTYVIAVFSDLYGWTATVYLWAGIAGVGVLICLAFAHVWKHFTER